MCFGTLLTDLFNHPETGGDVICDRASMAGLSDSVIRLVSSFQHRLPPVTDHNLSQDTTLVPSGGGNWAAVFYVLEVDELEIMTFCLETLL